MTSLHTSLALKEMCIRGKKRIEVSQCRRISQQQQQKKMSMKFWELVLSSGHHQGSKQKQTNKFCKHV